MFPLGFLQWKSAEEQPFLCIRRMSMIKGSVFIFFRLLLPECLTNHRFCEWLSENARLRQRSWTKLLSSVVSVVLWTSPYTGLWEIPWLGHLLFWLSLGLREYSRGESFPSCDGFPSLSLSVRLFL